MLVAAALNLFLTLNPLSGVQAQNATQFFPSTIWSGGNQTFSLGDASGLSGFEFNFWMMPNRGADDDIIIPVMTFLSTIELRYQLLHDPSNNLGNAIMLKYNGIIYNQTFPLFTPYQWMNVNMRIQFHSYITLSMWYGVYNDHPQPDLTLAISNPSDFTTMTFDLQRMNDTMLMYMAEIRVFELDLTRSFGQYFKYYYGIWPPNLQNNFDK
jgi:hypothetical protein